MKAYILVKEQAPTVIAILATAHASLAMYLKYQDDEDVIEWVSGPFYKVICGVSEKEFDKAKKYPDHVIITESKLDNEEITIAFKPRKEWPKFFQFLRLYK